MESKNSVKKITTSTKTLHPTINSLLIIFNLPLTNGKVHQFRQDVLNCIPDAEEREIWSNEAADKNGKAKRKDTYPLIQFRCHEHQAALFALQAGVPLVEKFLETYCNPGKKNRKPFFVNNDKFFLEVQYRDSKDNFIVKPFNPKLRTHPVIYRLHTWLPFSSSNYEWWKANRNEPDTVKTKKLEQLLVSHLCTFIHYTGGFIPRQKIKLTVLDKDRLKQVIYKDIGQVAFDIRYTVNLQLPQYIGLGNHPSHGFGWQRLEKE